MYRSQRDEDRSASVIFLGSVSKLKSLSKLLFVENLIPFLADRPSLIMFLLRVCYFIDNNRGGRR